ncbi:T9SS type A sorting domain-containing protein [Gelatiniphilus marinus]|uniref:T9SS type A sorting domain-containing protein n=1 Tax=Gelatiniphilus marinus TaxID=1759464 RepID=A0ABW5JRI5_9FLAO
MKLYVLLAIVLSFAFSLDAQNSAKSSSYNIIRTNLGVSGSSHAVVTKKGTYSISQSVGQASVIGTYSNNGYSLRQGYQQPLSKIKVRLLAQNNDLAANVYPNPFEQSVSIAFAKNTEKDILVNVFNLNGKLIYSKTFAPSQRIDIHFDNLSSGTYLLKAQSNNKLFHSKLIKK